MTEEQQADVLVEIKQSSSKGGSEGYRVVTTEDATEDGRKNAMKQALAARTELRQVMGLEEAALQ